MQNQDVNTTISSVETTVETKQTVVSEQKDSSVSATQHLSFEQELKNRIQARMNHEKQLREQRDREILETEQKKLLAERYGKKAREIGSTPNLTLKGLTDILAASADTEPAFVTLLYGMTLRDLLGVSVKTKVTPAETPKPVAQPITVTNVISVLSSLTEPSTIGEIAKMMSDKLGHDVSTSEIKPFILDLKEDGKLETVGEKRSTRYSFVKTVDTQVEEKSETKEHDFTFIVETPITDATPALAAKTPEPLSVFEKDSSDNLEMLMQDLSNLNNV